MTVSVVFAWAVLLWPGQSAARQPDTLGAFDVGHTRLELNLVGVAGEARPVDVEVWYPASHKGFGNAPPATYRSRLHGVTLDPARWDPLSWELVSAIARAGAPIHDRGQAFPVVIFTHGNGSTPFDYIQALEHLASHGYVVAAPWHTGNNQDDNRIGFLNRQAGWTAPGQPQLLPCLDGSAMPCVKNDSRAVAANRVRDISAIADTLPSVFGDRVDVRRIGVMGHSAGAITSVLAAGGSIPWAIPPEPRVAAVLGLTMIDDNVIDQVDLANVTVPALLVAGELDANTPPARTIRVYDGVSSADKAYVVLSDAVHRSFSFAFCAQMQASGAATLANPVRGILDRHTLTNMIGNAVNGSALDYCTHEDFTSPVDIGALVSSLAGGFAITETSVPRTGVAAAEVARIVNEMAVLFFSATLRNSGGDRLGCYLDHQLVRRHETLIHELEVATTAFDCDD
jgi:predicted dienelactone hydrolase